MGWGNRAPSPALPRAHPSHRPALPGQAGKGGSGEESEDQEVSEGTARQAAPRAEREPEAGGYTEPRAEPKAGWRQPRGL